MRKPPRMSNPSCHICKGKGLLANGSCHCLTVVKETCQPCICTSPAQALAHRDRLATFQQPVTVPPSFVSEVPLRQLSDGLRQRGLLWGNLIDLGTRKQFEQAAHDAWNSCNLCHGRRVMPPYSADCFCVRLQRLAKYHGYIQAEISRLRYEAGGQDLPKYDFFAIDRLDPGWKKANTSAYQIIRLWRKATIAHLIQEQPVAEQPSLYLHGINRTGKTTLSYVLSKELIQEGVVALYYPWKSFARAIRASYAHHSGTSMAFDHELRKTSATSIIEALSQAPVLLLDDVGRIDLAPDLVGHFFTLIDNRGEQLLPTVITTNYTLDEFSVESRFGPSLGHRIREDYHVTGINAWKRKDA